MNNRIFWQIILLIIFIVLLDFLSKILVFYLAPELILENSGYVFGWGFFPHDISFLIFQAILLVILGGIFCLSGEAKKNWLGTGLILGGVFSNFIDRIHDFQISDFISIWIFPKFNLADLSIVLGLAIIFFGLLRSKPD